MYTFKKPNHILSVQSCVKFWLQTHLFALWWNTSMHNLLLLVLHYQYLIISYKILAMQGILIWDISNAKLIIRRRRPGRILLLWANHEKLQIRICKGHYFLFLSLTIPNFCSLKYRMRVALNTVYCVSKMAWFQKITTVIVLQIVIF